MSHHKSLIKDKSFKTWVSLSSGNLVFAMAKLAQLKLLKRLVAINTC